MYWGLVAISCATHVPVTTEILDVLLRLYSREQSVECFVFVGSQGAGSDKFSLIRKLNTTGRVYRRMQLQYGRNLSIIPS